MSLKVGNVASNVQSIKSELLHEGRGTVKSSTCSHVGSAEDTRQFDQGIYIVCRIEKGESFTEKAEENYTAGPNVDFSCY